MADWREFDRRLEPEHDRIGLELSDIGALRVGETQRRACHFSGQNADYWQQKLR